MRIRIPAYHFDTDPDPTIQFDMNPCRSGSGTLYVTYTGTVLTNILQNDIVKYRNSAVQVFRFLVWKETSFPVV